MPKDLDSEDNASADEDIYTDEGREELMEEEDEITDVEEGFMQGYEEGERVSVCNNCGKALEGQAVETEIDNELYRFCSSRCAAIFEKSRKKQR